MNIHDMIEVLQGFRDNKKLQYKPDIKGETWIDVPESYSVKNIINMINLDYWIRLKPIPREWWQIRLSAERGGTFVREFVTHEQAENSLVVSPVCGAEIVHVKEVID